MNCLFLSCHASLEYYMCNIFKDIDITLPLFDMDIGNTERPLIPGYREPLEINKDTNKKHHNKLWTTADLKGIDFIYMMNFGDVDSKVDYYKQFNIPIIINMFGQYSINLVNRLLGIMQSSAHVYIVCYSETEYLMYSEMCKSNPGILHRIHKIKFGLDTNYFCNWDGNTKKVYTTCNDIHNRGTACGWPVYTKIIEGIPSILGGRHTEQVGGVGLLSFEDLLKHYQSNRCYLSMGTYPAPYVLNLIEAMMVGSPVVAWDHNCGIKNEGLLSSDGSCGLYSSNIDSIRAYIKRSIEDNIWAAEQGVKLRQKAVEIFNKDIIAKQWADLLTKI